MPKKSGLTTNREDPVCCVQLFERPSVFFVCSIVWSFDKSYTCTYLLYINSQITGESELDTWHQFKFKFKNCKYKEHFKENRLSIHITKFYCFFVKKAIDSSGHAIAPLNLYLRV